MTQDNTNIDAVLTRIQKLLALSQSPNEHEAAAAAAKAQELLFKYNLSMMDVQTGDKKRPVIERYNRRTVVLGKKREVLNWRRDLLRSLARLNFCRTVDVIGAEYTNLIGEDHNIEVVLNLYDYLFATIERLSAEGWEATKRENGGKAPVVWSDVVHRYVSQHAKNYRSSFSHGAVHSVIDRLNDQQAKSVVDAGSNALVVIAEEELTEAVNHIFSNSLVRRKQLRSDLDARAFGAGKEAGKRISLMDEVDSGRTKALKG